MLAQVQHRFSVGEYYRMAETGILSPDARVELLDGKIIDMSPIGPNHGAVTKRLNHIFTDLANDRWVVSVQDPVHLDEYSEPQPDLMLLKPAADYYASDHPKPEDVFLLIEVADSSLELDREQKLPAYGRAGVREVWIVNLGDKAIEVYREPHFAGYGSRAVVRSGDEVSLQAFPDVSLDTGKLFRMTE